jgi:hypothetical protein
MRWAGSERAATDPAPFAPPIRGSSPVPWSRRQVTAQGRAALLWSACRASQSPLRGAGRTLCAARKWRVFPQLRTIARRSTTAAPGPEGESPASLPIDGKAMIPDSAGGSRHTYRTHGDEVFPLQCHIITPSGAPVILTV